MLEKYTTALVTGGLGFVGRHLVRALSAEGNKVTIIDNGVTSLDATAPAGTTVIKADIRDPKQLAKVFDGVDIVFHLAANANGSVSVVDPRFDFEMNAIGSFNVLEAAAQANVKRFYYMSSASVYGRPQYTPMDESHLAKPFVPYGATKLTGELLAQSFRQTRSLPVVIGRPFCIYGPGENPKRALVEVSRYLRWHLNHQPIQIIGDAVQKTRDFVHVSDAVAGILCIADKGKPGEVYNIGSGTETSMHELVEVIEEAAGRKAEIQAVEDITDDTYRLVTSLEKLKTLGYMPKVKLIDGIQQLVASMGPNPELPEGATIFDNQQSGEAV